MTRRGARGRQGFRPLPRRRRRRHPLPHLSRHASRRKGAFFTRGTSQATATRAIPRTAPAYVDNMQRLLRKFETAKTLVPGPLLSAGAAADALRRDLFRLDQRRRWHEALDALDAHGHPRRRAARARLPVPGRGRRLRRRARHGVRGRAEPRRAAATLLVNECDIDPASLISMLHYDGTPITARFIAGEIAERIAALNVRPLQQDKAASHDLSRQAEAPSPDAAEEQARLHAPRLRGQRSRRCAPAAATTRSRPRSSRPAASSTSSRTASPSSPASAARRRRRTISSAIRTASTRVHGRMPSVLTGANLANRDLIYLGVSGDGDSASIGIGQFAHCMRRGVNMIYIVENNGVYGLTKGQFSATADTGSKSKRGVVNTDDADRPGVAGAAARRHLRRAQLLRRQEAAGAADQGARSRTRARPSSTSSAPASRSTTTPARPRATTTCASTTRR